jgi:hypothetical protein
LLQVLIRAVPDSEGRLLRNEWRGCGFSGYGDAFGDADADADDADDSDDDDSQSQ